MTIEYEMATPAARPMSSTIANFLRGSVSMSDLFRRVLREWIFVVVGTILGFLYGLHAVYVTPISYLASMSLLPADSNGGGISNGDPSGLGLLGALAGINTGSVPKFTRFVAALNTDGMATLLDKRYDMLCRIYRGRCDMETHEWHEVKGWDAWVASQLAGLAHLPDPNGKLSVHDLAVYVSVAVVPDPDKKTGMLTVTYADHDPKFAAEFLMDVINTTNDYIKAQDRAINLQFVDYLTRQLATTTSIAQHDAMSNLLIQQERNLMLTGVNVPYAAASMDRPVVEPGDPTRKLMALYTVLGLIMGVGAALGVTFIPDKWRFWSRIWTRR